MNEKLYLEGCSTLYNLKPNEIKDFLIELAVDKCPLIGPVKGAARKIFLSLKILDITITVSK